MMVFLFLRFPVRRRLRVFDVWISRRRVGFGTKTPGETLLRKCINPLRYFHPEAAKYRGLSEGDAASAETCGGLDAAVATAYAGDMMLFRITSPARAAWICGFVGDPFARLRNGNRFWRLPFLRLCFGSPPLNSEPAALGFGVVYEGFARKAHRGLPTASLGSAASVVRAMGFA